MKILVTLRMDSLRIFVYKYSLCFRTFPSYCGMWRGCIHTNMDNKPVSIWIEGFHFVRVFLRWQRKLGKLWKTLLVCIFPIIFSNIVTCTLDFGRIVKLIPVQHAEKDEPATSYVCSKCYILFRIYLTNIIIIPSGKNQKKQKKTNKS